MNLSSKVLFFFLLNKDHSNKDDILPNIVEELNKIRAIKHLARSSALIEKLFFLAFI